MTVVCYPNCITCKKALAWLKARGIPYVYRNIKEDNPSYEELMAWYAKSGLPLNVFFNTSGISYKALHLKDKLSAMRDDEALKLLASDGMLVKRPLIITDALVLVGFREKEWEKALT